MKLNLGCWVFYREGWINVDLDRYVMADLREDASTLPSITDNSIEEIYAGHLAEHVADAPQAFRRWFAVLQPGGRLTVTVPDGPGSVQLWLDRKEFPSLNAGPDEGMLQIATGIAPSTMHKRRDLVTHKRLFDSSLLRLCFEATGFVRIAPVDNHPIMVAPCSALGWQIAMEGYKP